MNRGPLCRPLIDELAATTPQLSESDRKKGGEGGEAGVSGEEFFGSTPLSPASPPFSGSVRENGGGVFIWIKPITSKQNFMFELIEQFINFTVRISEKFRRRCL
jgi:hypothetical protein